MKRKYIMHLLVLIILLFGSCSQNKGPEELYADDLVKNNHSVLSPSQEYSLEMDEYFSDNVTGFSFVVRSTSDNEEVYRSDDFYRLRDVTYLLWGDNDTIWVYSGDVGTLYWEKTSDGWSKNDYTKDTDSSIVPNALKELRPKYFS